MDRFIDRLADILRGLFDGEERSPDAREQREGRSGGARFADPDLADAMEELDDYLRTGSGSGRDPREKGAKGTPRDRRPIDESLRQDYANLEVPFGAHIEEVKRSYKNLMLKYHPDKHSGDTERQRIALEITKKINESFERIKKGSR